MVMGCASTPETDRKLVYLPRVRAYQLDISRNKVPTMASLYRIVDILKALDYNQFQLYTEHTFAYPNHEVAWRDASPMTPEEVKVLDAYCAERGIELVPNQNSFGHLDHWLSKPEYNDLAEVPQGGAFYAPWGSVIRRPSALCPTDERSIEFVAGLYDALFPCFKSQYVNVGCDETLELMDANKSNRSAKAVAELGPHRVYLEFLLKIHKLVKARQHTMMFWGDIIVNAPELISELPKDAVALCWGYEANHPFDKQVALFAEAHRRFMLCPGTSAWGSISGRIPNMMGNIDNAYNIADKYNAEGMLLADWGDGGHPQPWIVSIPALVYFSAKTHGRSLSRAGLAKEIDALLGAEVGSVLLDYGEIYLKCGGRMGNSTELFLALVDNNKYERAPTVNDEMIERAFACQREIASRLDLGKLPEWIKDDFATLDLLYRVVKARLTEPPKENFRANYESEYRRLWLKQNRYGGLEESLTNILGRF